MLRPINAIIRDNVGNIIHRGFVVTGEVAVDNGNGSYNVYIAGEAKAYPKIFTLARNPDLAAGDKVRILYKNGCKELPIILPPTKPTAPPVILTLISCDILSGRIYIHTGITSVIASYFNAPLVGYYRTPSGLTVANGNLISCDNWGAKIHVHAGITDTITDTFDSPGSQPTGLAFDGTNLISCDQGTDKIYIHDGISDVILDSFDAPVTGIYGIYGITIADGNLISCSNQSPTKIYVHNGVSSGVISSFSDPDGNPTGLAFDGANLINAGNSANKIYIHTGITVAVSNSFNSPSSNPTGLTVLIE